MTASLFEYYTKSPITSSLKRKRMNLPVVSKQIPSNLKNFFMLVKINTVRSRHLFLSIEQVSILGACFMWRNAELEVHKTVLLGKGKPNPGSSFFSLTVPKTCRQFVPQYFVCCADRLLRSKNVPERYLSANVNMV